MVEHSLLLHVLRHAQLHFLHQVLLLGGLVVQVFDVLLDVLEVFGVDYVCLGHLLELLRS